MKMRDITNIIKHNMALKYTTNKNNHYEIDFTFKKNIKELTTLPCFETFYDLHDFFLNTDAIIFFKNNDNISVFNRVNTLKTLCSLYVRSFNNFYPEINEYTISFKFKETNDLEVIAKTMLSLNKALNQIFSGNSLNSSYQLSNFDQGSKWIDIIIEKKEAFACFAAVIGFVATIANKIQEIRLNEANIIKIKTETQEKLKDNKLKDLEIEKLKKELKILEASNQSKELQTLLIDKEIENKIVEIIDNYYNSDKNFELPNRIKFAIDELVELQIEKNYFRPTDLIAYNIPQNDLNPWGYIEESEKKKIEYKEEKETDI